MSTTNCVWDGNSQTETKYDDELDYNNLWEPWKNIIISVETATANISHLQKIAKRKNKQINTHDFAEALEDRNLLQHTITIQIASNGNFVSIEFGKQETMEQFCCEPLSIQDFNVTFYPERRKKQLKPRRLMSVSFINILPETPEEIVTELLDQYADIDGNPMYVKKTHNGKTYCTGTRVYQITKLYQHIPRRLPNMFGRTIMTYNQSNRNTTKIADNSKHQLNNKHQNKQLILTQTPMKTQIISGNNRDAIGRNKTNKKENKLTRFTTTLPKDEIKRTTKWNNNPRTSMTKTNPSYHHHHHHNNTNIKTQQHLPQMQNKTKMRKISP